MNKINQVILCCFSLVLLPTMTSYAQDPLFPNSVVSNDIDFILDTDPDDFLNLEFLGLEDKEMPDSQSDILFDENTFIFEASFANGESVEIWCHSSFGSQSAAQEYADKLCPRLGKLPLLHRDMLHHVVIHNGDATAFAEGAANFFVLYSDNMDARISTHDLEETVFHESVHASIQGVYQSEAIWLDAQANDDAFVTEYGQNLPGLEDMAESALFAYTAIVHPGRLSNDIEAWLEENIPNRMAFFRTLYDTPNHIIALNPNELELQIYPNPTQATIDLSNYVYQDGDVITVTNLAGKIIHTQEAIPGRNAIDLSKAATGLYIFQITGHQAILVSKY